MKTRILAGSALALFPFFTPASALDIRVGGNVAFMATDGRIMVPDASVPGGVGLSSKKFEFTTDADLTVEADYRTAMLDYGAYINFDFEPGTTGAGINSNNLTFSDLESHIRIRFSHGTLRLGTDIDGLQDAEDLDWITKGPIEPSNAVSAPLSGQGFTHSKTKASIIGATGSDVSEKAVGESSLTFTSATVRGITLAGEITPDSANGGLDWGASAKYVGAPYHKGLVTAVVATDSSKALMGNAKIEFGDLALNVFAGKDDDKEKYEGGAIAYDLGKVMLSGGYIVKQGEQLAAGTAGSAAEQTDILLGASYTLAPGLVIDGSYSMEERTKAATAATSAKTVGADRFTGRIKLTF